MHKVLCCGGRNYHDYQLVSLALDNLRLRLGDFAVIHGNATGADELSGLWGRSKGLPVIQVPANWHFYSKSAGTIRNGWILDLCAPTCAVAFPGGKGTADMITKCKAAGLDVWEININN
jgi:hypothetical protein